MTSSVDPTNEIAAILTRLDGLRVTDPTTGLIAGVTYEGVEQGTKLQIDAFGRKLPYRDFEAGSSVPLARGRLLAANEQSQPHSFAFQIHHFATSRPEANILAVETDVCLIGWEPTLDSGPITMFYFTTYDETAKNGERVGWIATRFYEVPLGVRPDFAPIV